MFFVISLDLSGKCCLNEHFLVENIFNLPQISLTTQDTEKILQKI